MGYFLCGSVMSVHSLSGRVKLESRSEIVKCGDLVSVNWQPQVDFRYCHGLEEKCVLVIDSWTLDDSLSDAVSQVMGL